MSETGVSVRIERLERLDQSLAATCAALACEAFVGDAPGPRAWLGAMASGVARHAGPGTLTTLTIAETIPGTLAWHTVHHAVDGDPAPSPGLLEALGAEAEAGFPNDDFAAHAGHRGDHPRRSSGPRRALMGDERWFGTTYAAFRRPLGLHEFVRAVVPFSDVDAPRVMVLQIDLTRPDTQPTDRHVTLVGALAPVFQRAYHARFIALRQHRRATLARLTRAQAIVLPHLVEGLSESEVAREIGRSAHTVHDHTKTIYQTLGVNSRLQLRDLWFGRRPGAPDPDATTAIGEGIGHDRD